MEVSNSDVVEFLMIATLGYFGKSSQPELLPAGIVCALATDDNQRQGEMSVINSPARRSARMRISPVNSSMQPGVPA